MFDHFVVLFYPCFIFKEVSLVIRRVLIDMLGRAGRLEEAEKVALQVPHEVANAVMWRTLLGACNVHNNVEIGQRVTNKILEMERGHGGDYVLMSNILVGVGRFKDAESFCCSMSSICICDTPESDIRLKCYDHLNFWRASVVQFRAPRHIMCPNLTSV